MPTAPNDVSFSLKGVNAVPVPRLKKAGGIDALPCVLMVPSEVKKEFTKLLGPGGCLDKPEDLTLYEYDAGADKATPGLVVFPRTTEDAVGIVKIASQAGLPVVARGAGTGLSGGSIPRAGGVVVVFTRMNRILEVDLENECAVVEAGVANRDITLAVEGENYFFAPDPSSQPACTIGGNVAANASGAHTLAYGATTNHILGVEAVLADGTVFTTGGKQSDLSGYDITGLLTGAEGILGLVTKVIVKLTRKREMVKTLLAIYDAAEDAGETVSEITARGITPVAVEMLDGVLIRMVEEATHAGYPIDASAVLLIELEGLEEALEEQAEQIREVCQLCRAREIHVARSDEERALLWKGRKGAGGAVGRVSPFYCTYDGVVPRTKIVELLRFIRSVAEKHGLTISNILHAGDGNVHPNILFDPRRPGDLERARAAGADILRECVVLGGTITGEHGVGMEKNELMGDMFSDDSLDAFSRVKTVFDPEWIMNPGKVLPNNYGPRRLFSDCSSELARV